MPPIREEFMQAQEIFPAASYAFILYGRGFKTTPRAYPRRKDLPERAQRRSQDLSNQTSRLISGLPTNRDLLNALCGRELVGS